ncbi:MAG: hypothetical protein L0J12_04410 [Enterobacterales bacterium]|nr:hypothetical protein [Enterobacterales bacterium]MDN6633519.1 hypothetical protein [Enterobacterales bacterium]
MEPHQQRVVDEANELEDKLTKLSAFIESSPVFAGLDSMQQDLLKAQAGAMSAYLQILKLRIASF